MTNWLLRRLIGQYEDVSNPRVRGRYGLLAGLTGIVCNLLLFIAKLFIGLLSGSVAIAADAVNNLADAASSIMTLLGFRLAARPADEEHPFGHARYEYLSGLGVAVLILLIGAQMIRSSIAKILQPEPVLFSLALCVVLLLSIVLKLWLARFNRHIGLRIGSKALEATAADSRNDVISTSGVLLCAIVSHLSGLELDGYVGLLVAVFIIYSGIGIGKETLRPLLGAAPDPALLLRLREETLSYHACILGVHDIIVHDYGPGRRFASLHAEVSHKEDVLLAHEVIDGIERHFRKSLGLELVIHYDPVVTDDEELNTLRALVLSYVAGISEELSPHDFRLVRGAEQCNVIFDIAVPYSFVGRERSLQEALAALLRAEDARYHLILSIDYHGLPPD